MTQFVKEFEDKVKNLKFPSKNDYDDIEQLRTDRREYNRLVFVVERVEFKQAALEDLGLVQNPKANLLFEKAWDRSRSDGLEAVYNTMVDLMDLID